MFRVLCTKYAHLLMRRFRVPYWRRMLCTSHADRRDASTALGQILRYTPLLSVLSEQQTKLPLAEFFPYFLDLITSFTFGSVIVSKSSVCSKTLCNPWTIIWNLMYIQIIAQNWSIHMRCIDEYIKNHSLVLGIQQSTMLSNTPLINIASKFAGSFRIPISGSSFEIYYWRWFWCALLVWGITQTILVLFHQSPVWPW